MSGLKMLITDKYKKQNEDLHKRSDYGRGGYKHLGQVKKLKKKYDCDTVLDYGAGKATLSGSADFTVVNYDPCVPEYSEMPDKCDLVACTDVLEHIEPDLIGNVVSHIHSVTGKVAYFVIALRKDSKKTLPDGSNPHKIVQCASEWISLLEDYFLIEGVTIKKDYEVKLICIPK